MSNPIARDPLWIATEDLPRYAPLPQDTSADACVVGAGIAGLTTAHHLARQGRSVVVVEDGPVAGGMSSHTSAHLTWALDDRFFEIERLHRTEGARLAGQSHAGAIDRIERIASEEGIDCDFRRVDGYLFLGEGDDEELLDVELRAIRHAGLTGVEKIANAPGFDTGPCLRFQRQAQFHPVRYLAGLARAIERHGGRIHGGTHAIEVKDGSPCTVTTTRGVVTAPTVVVATNVPVVGRVAIPIREAAYMTYLVAAEIPRDSVPACLWWDTQDPYHYVRTVPGERGGPDVLLIGGEDHRTAHEHDHEDRYARLEAWARARFPRMGAVLRTWCGQVVETMDGLAFIGRNPGDEHVLICSGDSGMGLTHGTIAGMLLADIACGRDNPWAALYDPGRVKAGAAWTLLKENAKTNARYAEYLRKGDVGDPAEIEAGAGAVLLEGGRRIACFRDDGGALHRMSAVCPHLGCIVHWNRDRRTWDCPCHGSRFDALGTVVNGPANSDLEPVPAPDAT